jgi:hypothetical protein
MYIPKKKGKNTCAGGGECEEALLEGKKKGKIRYYIYSKKKREKYLCGGECQEAHREAGTLSRRIEG